MHSDGWSQTVAIRPIAVIRYRLLSTRSGWSHQPETGQKRPSAWAAFGLNLYLNV